MQRNTKQEWFKGMGCSYRPEDDPGQGLRVVLGGRTWTIRPEAD